MQLNKQRLRHNLCASNAKPLWSYWRTHPLIYLCSMSTLAGWTFNIAVRLKVSPWNRVRGCTGLTSCWCSKGSVVNSVVRSLLPTNCWCRGVLWYLIAINDTKTLGRTPLDEGLTRRWGLCLYKKHHSQETNIHDFGGIRTPNPI